MWFWTNTKRQSTKQHLNENRIEDYSFVRLFNKYLKWHWISPLRHFVANEKRSIVISHKLHDILLRLPPIRYCYSTAVVIVVVVVFFFRFVQLESSTWNGRKNNMHVFISIYWQLFEMMCFLLVGCVLFCVCTESRRDIYDDIFLH